MKRFILAVAIVLTAAASASAQTAKVKEYDPKTQTAAQAVVTSTDPQLIAKAQANANAAAPATTPKKTAAQIAQEFYNTWYTKKHKCYVDAGLTFDGNFRFNEQKREFEVMRSVHLAGSGFNSPAIETCDAITMKSANNLQ